MGAIRSYRRSVARYKGIPWGSWRKPKLKLVPNTAMAPKARPKSSWAERNLPTFTKLWRRMKKGE